MLWYEMQELCFIDRTFCLVLTESFVHGSVYQFLRQRIRQLFYHQEELQKRQKLLMDFMSCDSLLFDVQNFDVE